MLEHLEDREASGDHRGSDGVRKEIGACSLTAELDDLAASAQVPAGSAPERLAEGPGDNVDARGDPEVLGGTASPLADDTDRMRIVDHNHRPVAIGKFTDPIEWCQVAIH